MSRILASLAVADLVLWVGSGVLGFLVHDDGGYARHFILALFTSLLTVFIHAVALTYFSASGRMISQAVFIGHLAGATLDQVRVNKGRVVRWIGVGVSAVVVNVAFGALTARDSTWHVFHVFTSVMGMFANAAAFWVIFGAVCDQSNLMRGVFSQYQDRRTQIRRGDVFPARESPDND